MKVTTDDGILSVSTELPTPTTSKIEKPAELESAWFQQAQELKNANTAMKMEMRKLYAKLTFGLVCLWIASVMLTVCFSGFYFDGFKLPPSVLITLLTTTTANIAGFLTIVFGYLFKDDN